MPRGISIEGVANLERKLRDLSSATRKAAEKVVKEGLDETRDDARRTAPHDTGDLERHIDVDLAAGALQGAVKSTSRHAGFVEHGTYKDKAQPYMKPAAERARRRLPALATRIIKVFVEDV